MSGDGGEIQIGAEQLDTRGDASLGDDAVDGAPDRDAFAAQPAKQAGRGGVPFEVKTQHGKSDEESAGPLEVAVGAKALQHLRQDHRHQARVLTAECLIQAINLR